MELWHWCVGTVIKKKQNPRSGLMETSLSNPDLAKQ
jgi:hypothetical protein